MALDISLTAGMRADLISLQGTANLLNRTQQRLSTGKSVNSAVDDPSKFFAAQDHTNHAGDLSARKADMGEAIQAVKAANQGITSVTALINQARSLAQSAGSANITNRATLAAQFNTLRTQIDQMAGDSGYNGKNFLQGDSLRVLFNESGDSLLTVTGFDSTSTGLGITSAAFTGTETMTAAHANESMGTDLATGSTVNLAHTGAVSTVTITQSVSVASGGWIGSNASASDLNGTVVSLNHAGVASSISVYEKLKAVSADVILSTAAVTGATATMSLTLSAAPLSVVVKASGTTLVDGTDYTATFSGGRLHIELLQSTATNISVTYTYKQALVAGTDYNVSSSGGAATAGSVTFLTGFAAASAIGVDYTYAATVSATKYAVDAANGETKGSVSFNTAITGDVTINYKASTDSLWGTDTAIQTDLDKLNTAISTLRTQASTLAANLSVITTRQDWSQGIIDTLQQGADGLTLADMNEEGANMLALQTRQQLGIQALSLASQANQSIMRLFG